MKPLVFGTPATTVDAPIIEQQAITTAKSRAMTTVTITDDQIESLGQQHAAKLSTFSDQILAQVRTTDMDVFGDNLNQLVTVAKGLDPTKFRTKGVIASIRNLFSSVKDKMLAEYSTVSSRMDQLVSELDKNAGLFVKRVGDLEQMSIDNHAAHQALAASKEEGEQMLQAMQADLVTKQQDTGDAFHAQELYKMQNRIDRLSKRIDDINRAMMLSKQIHPQIEILKDNSRTLSSKFVDVKVTTIPAWKSAFGLYILQMEQKKGAELVNSIHDATDAAFKMQADLMRLNVQEIAKAKQRSVVSYETLEHVQKQLLGAFDDMEKIAEQGRADRKAAEPKIKALEEQLIQKFLPRKN